MVVLRRSLLGCAALSLAACLAGCQPKTATVDTPVDLARDADAIRSAEADRVEEMNDRDLDHAAAHFAPAASIAWPGALPVRGTAQIRSTLAQTFQDPAFAVDWRADRVTVAKDGDVAWATGGYSVTRTDPTTHKPVVTKGPFVETFIKTPEGRWLIAAGVSGAASNGGGD
jgi:ketosteroid isomerase-like protein